MADEDNDLKDTVQRLHRFIVDALRAKRDDPFGSPVTVSEIYQQLAPYRTVRTVLGFEMNADYEHALTRLLAGVDGLTLLEPEKARDRLAKELESPNPDVGMYREFAACDVILNPSTSGGDWVREQLDDTDMPSPAAQRASASAAPDWGALADLDPGTSAVMSDRHDDREAGRDAGIDEGDDDVAEPIAPPATPVPASHAGKPVPAMPQSHEKTPAQAAPPSHENSRAHATCIYCDSKLPGSRNLRFCPFCGADQSLAPCPACGESIEPGWAFCITCGTSVASAE